MPAPPDREEGSLIWGPASLDPAALMKSGWKVYSFRDVRERYIAPARSRGIARTSLDNPAQPWLDLLSTSAPLAVVGVSLRTAADLRDLYGFVIEPAYRRGMALLISSDRELHEFDRDSFVDPVGYPWTLERLQYVAARFSLGPGPDGLPPLTPIEALLYASMRAKGLAPIAQYGIGKYRADFAFTDVRLVVECDGRPWHDPQRDRRRDAVLRRKGWESLHFTGSEITHGAPACAAKVVREVVSRRMTADSVQPEIFVPVRRSWWARLKGWLGVLLGMQAGGSGAAESTPSKEAIPEDGPIGAWAASLDPEQRAAVMSHDGVVQVIAPAGSGKTTVLVARVRELVARGVPPNRILCCTFNTAAANELRMRLDQAGVDGVEAATFHAVGRRILKRADLLRGDILPIGYGQWRRLAKLAMDGTPEGVWIEAPASKEQISNLKLGRMLTVDEFDAVAAGPLENTIATLYRLYEADLERQQRIDFDDLIFKGVRLLQVDSKHRMHWQGEFTAVLVDEYQDIEPAQELLVQMLAAPEDLLLCVGDEDQCLYAWRRASVERIIELDQLYPGLERHALSRNYRCPVQIVDASRHLIGHNRRRFPKQILAARAEAGEISLAAASGLEAQGAHAARLVKDLEQGHAVILARTSRVLSEIALGLAQAGIRFFGPERIKLRSGGPAVLLSYLRVLGAPGQARPEDVDAIFRVPNRYLPNDAEDNVASALRSGQSFLAAIERLRVKEEWRRKSLLDAAHLFDELNRLTDASELIRRLRTEGGLDRHYSSAEQLSPADKSEVDSLEQAEENASGMSVIEFAGALDYQANIIEQHFDQRGIELATIHGAKGRQWPLVILAGLEEGDLPHARSLQNASDPVGELEGERRLAYVAFTRATERLVLLYEASYPSRFIGEAALAVAEMPADVATNPESQVLVSGRTGGGPSKPTDPTPRSPVPNWPDPKPHLDAEPLALVRSAQRGSGGSIPCSLPGCGGTVGEGFVIELDGNYVGICPRQELHEGLIEGNPEVAAVLAELTILTNQARGVWRSSRADPSGGLVGGAIHCSLTGCEGIVKPEYVVEIDGVETGLCGQRMLHSALARRSETVAEELRDLEAKNRAQWLGGRNAGLRADLLLKGGIPCSLSGCDGIVGAGYIMTTNEGAVGICGMRGEHMRLMAADPALHLEFERLLALGYGYGRPGLIADALDEDEAVEIDINDVPF